MLETSISPFPTMFSKDSLDRVVESQDVVVEAESWIGKIYFLCP